MDGARLIMLGSNNYLGLASRPPREAGRDRGRREWGAGTTGSRSSTEPRAAHRAGAAAGPLPPPRRRHLLHLRLHGQPGRHLRPGAARRRRDRRPAGARQHPRRLPALHRRGEAVPPQRRRRPGAGAGDLRRRRHAGGGRRGLLDGGRHRPAAPHRRRLPQARGAAAAGRRPRARRPRPDRPRHRRALRPGGRGRRGPRLRRQVPAGVGGFAAASQQVIDFLRHSQSNRPFLFAASPPARHWPPSGRAQSWSRSRRAAAGSGTSPGGSPRAARDGVRHRRARRPPSSRCWWGPWSTPSRCGRRSPRKGCS